MSPCPDFRQPDAPPTAQVAGAGRLGSPRLLDLLIALTAAVCGSEGEPLEQNPLVRAASEGYRKAILDGDGRQAVEFVDTKTLEYYQRMRDIAYHSAREEVEALRMIDRLTVFTVRHGIEPAMVKEMDGRSLFIYAVDSEWIGRSSVVNNALGRVVVTDNAATGVAIVDGKPTPLRWTLREEGGHWRIDLTSLMPRMEITFRHLLKQSGDDPNEFLFRLLTSVSGTEVTDSVWTPMAE